MATKVFNFESHDVMTINRGGNVWFRGKDVAKALGYARPKDAVFVHVDHDLKTRGGDSQPPLGIDKQTIFISEPGIYSLIFSSKLYQTQNVLDVRSLMTFYRVLERLQVNTVR